jgi:hypothetical protein
MWVGEPGWVRQILRYLTGAMNLALLAVFDASLMVG